MLLYEQLAEDERLAEAGAWADAGASRGLEEAVVAAMNRAMHAVRVALLHMPAAMRHAVAALELCVAGVQAAGAPGDFPICWKVQG